MPVQPLTQAELLELWRRVMPASYTVPIEDGNGAAFDVPSAQAAIFAYGDVNVNQTFQAHFLKPHALQTAPPASGSARATVNVDITRSTSAAGEIVLAAGTRLQAEQTGSLGQTVRLVDFELVSDTSLPDGDRGPHTAAARAILPGYAGNVAAGSIVGFVELGRAAMDADVTAQDTLSRVAPAPGDPITDRFTLNMVGRYATIVGATGVPVPRRITSVSVSLQQVTIDPPLDVADVGSTVAVEVAEYADLGLTVEQTASATGGLLATLDAIGRDRRTARVVAETDAQYRDRLCEVDDVVSPAAIDRICDRILTPCGINYVVKETRDIASLKGFVWDLDPLDFGQVPEVPRDPAGDLVGEGAVLLDQASSWTFFLVCVGEGNDGEFGAPFDATNPITPNAFSQFAWDGFPVGYNSCLGQLWDSLNAGRAAGVNFALFRDPGL